MTKRKAIKILSQIGKPLGRDKKYWISDKRFLKAIEILELRF